MTNPTRKSSRIANKSNAKPTLSFGAPKGTEQKSHRKNGGAFCGLTATEISDAIHDAYNTAPPAKGFGATPVPQGYSLKQLDELARARGLEGSTRPYGGFGAPAAGALSLGGATPAPAAGGGFSMGGAAAGPARPSIGGFSLGGATESECRGFGAAATGGGLFGSVSFSTQEQLDELERLQERGARGFGGFGAKPGFVAKPRKTRKAAPKKTTSGKISTDGDVIFNGVPLDGVDSSSLSWELVATDKDGNVVKEPFSGGVTFEITEGMDATVTTNSDCSVLVENGGALKKVHAPNGDVFVSGSHLKIGSVVANTLRTIGSNHTVDSVIHR